MKLYQVYWWQQAWAHQAKILCPSVFIAFSFTILIAILPL
jgi:hypothetical protein